MRVAWTSDSREHREPRLAPRRPGTRGSYASEDESGRTRAFRFGSCDDGYDTLVENLTYEAMDTWIEVMAAEDIEPNTAVGVVINGRDIAIYNDGGRYFATDNICTHAEAFLSDGFLENGEIECPLHQARFDIRTGKVAREPAIEHLETFPVIVEAGRIFVKIGEGK